MSGGASSPRSFRPWRAAGAASRAATSSRRSTAVILTASPWRSCGRRPTRRPGTSSTTGWTSPARVPIRTCQRHARSGCRVAPAVHPARPARRVNGFYPHEFAGEDVTGWDARPPSVVTAAAQVRTCQQARPAGRAAARAFTAVGVQRAAAFARESRNHAVVGHQQAVNRFPADRGQAGRQADRRRMPRRSGEHLLSKLPLATRHPTADDRAGQLPDPASVSVCGSARKLPANASRAVGGSARSRPAMLSPWPPITSGTCPPAAALPGSRRCPGSGDGPAR